MRLATCARDEESGELETKLLERTPAAEAEWDSYVSENSASAVYHLAQFRAFIESATGNKAW